MQGPKVITDMTVLDSYYRSRFNLGPQIDLRVILVMIKEPPVSMSKICLIQQDGVEYRTQIIGC